MHFKKDEWFKGYDFTDFQYDRISAAYGLFRSPYDDEYSMYGKIKDKAKVVAPLITARDRIADIIDDDEALKAIDTKIFWKAVSSADIKKQFTERTIAVLSPHFTQTQVDEILIVFKNILKAK